MNGQINEEMIAGCEQEDLRHSGAILGDGALLHVGAADQRITHVSENIARFAARTPEQLLGRPFAESGIPIALDPADIAMSPGSRTLLGDETAGAAGQWRYVVTVVKTGWLVEIVPAPAAREGDAAARYQRIEIDTLAKESEIAQFAGRLAAAVRDIAGFDRVMVYRFEDDWSGTVIAEESAPGIGSYMGLRFPASDIPKIARDLYMSTPYRYIPDSAALAVKVVSTSGEPLDLTHADLRSVSPLHLEYLRNMGVASSFSIPIMVQGGLWGLLACHALRPGRLGQASIRQMRRLVNEYAVGLANFTVSRRMTAISTIQRTLDEIGAGIAAPSDLPAALARRGTDLAALIQCEAGAVALNDATWVYGAPAPDREVVEQIDAWFANECPEAMFSTDNLSGVMAAAARFTAQVSGVYALKVQAARFYWFRPELVQQVDWAGNPDKAVVGTSGRLELSPRKSFEKWLHVKHGYSDSWRNEHRMAAKKIGSVLQTWPSLRP